jgi:hypothetical protein
MQNNVEIDSKRYTLGFALRHRHELKSLTAGKVLGKDSKGWRNIAEHCFVAGIMAETLANILNFSATDRKEVTSAALTHDAQNRLEKEATKSSEVILPNGRIVIKQEDKNEAILERTKQGLARVTGNDWRDFDLWGIKEKVLRYVDSSIGENAEGKAAIVDWRWRIEDLKKRKPQLHTQEGILLYGIPLYDKLAQLMEVIEKELYNQIIANNPRLAEKYTTPASLIELVKNSFFENINSLS